LTITSSVEQDVYITAHTWEARCIADKCENWNSGFSHSAYYPGSKYNWTFKYGAMQLEPLHMLAG